MSEVPLYLCTPEALLQSDYPFSGVLVEFDSKEVLGSPTALQRYLAYKKMYPPRTLQ